MNSFGLCVVLLFYTRRLHCPTKNLQLNLNDICVIQLLFGNQISGPVCVDSSSKLNIYFQTYSK